MFQFGSSASLLLLLQRRAQFCHLHTVSGHLLRIAFSIFVGEIM